MRSVLILVAACGSGAVSSKPIANPPAKDVCETGTDKISELLARKFERTMTADERLESIEECRGKPEIQATAACLTKAEGDEAIEKCMADDRPTKKKVREPFGDLDKLVENLQIYQISHEVLLEGNVAMTPAQACCKYDDSQCPAGSWSDPTWEALGLDNTKPRSFQYRFEGTRKKVVIEAVGDRDCDGIMVTYRRELEMRADGKLHITVVDAKPTDD